MHFLSFILKFTGLSRQNLLHQSIEPQGPESTIQLLGKRGREYSTISGNVFSTGGLGQKDGSAGTLAPDAASLRAMQSPKKKQRVENNEDLGDEIANIQSPFRLTSRDEHALADKIPTNGLDFASLFNFNLPSTTAGDADTVDADDITVTTGTTQNTDTMLGVPPPGFRPDFLTQPTTPLPFALTPSGASGSNPSGSNQTPRLKRVDHTSSRKVTNSRLNPYGRTTSSNLPSRIRTPSNGIDPFNFFGADLPSSNFHRSNNPEPSVGVNPAQLLVQDIFDPDKTPAAARTLYGTELEGDTRFGEFGIDGLTKTFWKAPGFPR
jgi:hypothetical protein